MPAAGPSWTYLERFDQHWLMLDGIEVALVSRRADAAWPWLVHVNRHRGIDNKLVGGKARTLDHGKKMAERWLMANQSRLRREVTAIRERRSQHRV